MNKTFQTDRPSCRPVHILKYTRLSRFSLTSSIFTCQHILFLDNFSPPCPIIPLNIIRLDL